MLSNILLNELDKELHARGLRFVRYADDCSIYVKSRKSADRVMRSITGFIEINLKLKVNKAKSKVSRPTQSTLLGFSFYKMKNMWLIRIAKGSVLRMWDKVKRHLRRNNPSSLETKVKGLRAVIIGWMNYFMIAESKTILEKLDNLTRTRARICQWHQWKRVRTRIKHLIRLGIDRQKAYMWGNTSKGTCKVAHSPILTSTLSIKYLSKLGLVSFYQYYYNKRKLQLELF